MSGRTHQHGIKALERLRAATDGLRVAVGVAIMPAHVAEMLRDHVDVELEVIHLRMIIGDDQEALMESMAAAFNAAARDGITIADALNRERDYVARYGPRYPT